MHPLLFLPLVLCPDASGVVVSVSPEADKVGLAVLADKGNAVDAAVAVGFALAVTWPEAGNIGGGGFMLVRGPGAKETPTVFDYRETAPAAADKDLFVREGKPAHLTVGVPGSVAGLALAHKSRGKLPWKRLVEPAIKLASEGVAVDDALAGSLNAGVSRGKANAELVRVYGRADRRPWKKGDRLVQPDLAKTLRRIADKGAEGFYAGETAELLVKEMKANKGIVTAADLAGYKAKEREPVSGTFRGHTVYAPAPPSSGGLVLIRALQTLEALDLKSHPRDSATAMHLMAEAMRRAYHERAMYVGDQDFAKVPTFMLDPAGAKKIAAGIDVKRATPSRDIAGVKLADDKPNTTHYSVIDAEGTAVGTTTTLEDSFGAKVVVPGAGFLLNNEMTDFNPQPGVTDTKGRIGTEPNLIAPGKRMVSSMCPTIVVKDGKTVLVTGSPGGRTIINTVLCVVVNAVEYGMPVADAVKHPRMHHQWFPDRIQVEAAFFDANPKAVAGLKARGHTVQRVGRQGDAHSIGWDAKRGEYVGTHDHRRQGRPAE